MFFFDLVAHDLCLSLLPSSCLSPFLIVFLVSFCIFISFAVLRPCHAPPSCPRPTQYRRWTHQTSSAAAAASSSAAVHSVASGVAQKCPGVPPGAWPLRRTYVLLILLLLLLLILLRSSLLPQTWPGNQSSAPLMEGSCQRSPSLNCLGFEPLLEKAQLGPQLLKTSLTTLMKNVHRRKAHYHAALAKPGALRNDHPGVSRLERFVIFAGWWEAQSSWFTETSLTLTVC